jgi:hypothetical protein
MEVNGEFMIKMIIRGVKLNNRRFIINTPSSRYKYIITRIKEESDMFKVTNETSGLYTIWSEDYIRDNINDGSWKLI